MTDLRLAGPLLWTIVSISTVRFMAPEIMASSSAVAKMYSAFLYKAAEAKCSCPTSLHDPNQRGLGFPPLSF